MRSLTLALCLGVAGCYPPIDELVTDETPPSAVGCEKPDESLGVAAPASLPNTAFPRQSGATHQVEPGADLQAVIDAALPGDTIVLRAGAEYAGPFRLPYKAEPGVIVIQSSALGDLPQGRSVTLDDTPKLATVLGSDTEPAVIAEERAERYRLAGLELRPPAGVAGEVLLQVGSTASTIAEALPTEIVIDRCLVRGDPLLGARIGIEINGRSVAIVDSRITDVKRTTPDSRGLSIINAPGPILVESSVIEAAWQNVVIGEQAPGAAALYPSDITLCRCVLTKPAAWQAEGWGTRALFEIFRGRRVLLTGSLLERAWPNVQPGLGIAISADAISEGFATEDLAFVDVRVRNVEMALETATAGTIGSIARVVVENSELTQASDRLVRLLGGGVQDLKFVHATGAAGHSILDASGGSNAGLLLRDSLFDAGLYGIRGDAVGSGVSALDAYFAPWTVTRNIIVGASESDHPPDNFYPPTMFEAGVVDAAGGNYRLAPTSPFAGQATDGKDPGANIDRLEAALPPE